MATEILNEATEKNIDEMVASRADRGWGLYPTKRRLITKTGERRHLHRAIV